MTDHTRLRPTWHTLSWAGLCGAMVYSGAVQSNGAAYLLAFLSVCLGLLSIVHARANLRGLDLRIIGTGPRREGGALVLMVELRAATGAGHHGVELVLAGADRATFVGHLESGARTRVAVPAPEGGGPFHLRLRSRYPLGIFQVLRDVVLTQVKAAPPAPSGTLPLPEAGRTLWQGDAATQAAGNPGREGDDFAGVREWRPGDSPRHIDWRALARGRPLLVKTWSGGAGAVVELDWEAVPLPAEERGGQLARWIETCERQGAPYSLKLPNRALPAGLGAEHAALCLEALAELGAGLGTRVDGTGRGRFPAGYESRGRVGLKPLALLGAVVLAVALMLLDFMPWASALMLVLCLAWRLKSGPIGRGWPMLVLAAGVGVIGTTSGGVWNMEAGIALLVVLLGGKLLEARSPHDFQVIAMIGWFLCLCGLLTDQGIARVLLMNGALGVVTGCMLWFRRGEGTRAPWRLTLRLLAQALPLAVVIFFIFPRVSLDLLARAGGGKVNQTGVTNHLEPGRVSQVAKSDATAFRVRFPGGMLPARQDLYWRCVVLWECDGLVWRHRPWMAFAPMRMAGPGDVAQAVTLEPHGQSWLPSLERALHPAQGGGRNALYADGTLGVTSVPDRVTSLRRYEVVSRFEPLKEPLPPPLKNAALQVPARVSPRLEALAAQWRAASADDAGVVKQALDYLRTQGFEYTLEPGEYRGAGALEEFVFERRTGFCEHFSAAFATLMRLAGVPARVVLGYLGGEYSERGGYLIVRQADAHAWTEVWLEETGWTRVDPTVTAAPSRGSLDLQSFLLGDEEALERARNSLVGRLIQQARLTWDHWNFVWLNSVVNFDREAQLGWLSWMGLEILEGLLTQLVLSFILLLAAAAALHFWLRRPAVEADPWARAWHRLCRRLERQGLPRRLPHEGPLAYSERLDTAPPSLRKAARLYAEGRYGRGGAALADFEKAVALVLAEAGKSARGAKTAPRQA